MRGAWRHQRGQSVTPTYQWPSIIGAVSGRYLAQHRFDGVAPRRRPGIFRRQLYREDQVEMIRKRCMKTVLITAMALALWPIGASAAGPSPPARETGRHPLSAQTTAHRSVQFGVASYYGRWHRGRITASGVPFDDRKLTAAHRTLPLGTHVKVTNLKNGRSVVVKINDRGPYVHHRLIDLSAAAARILGFTHRGVAPVQVRVIAPPNGQPDVEQVDTPRPPASGGGGS